MMEPNEEALQRAISTIAQSDPLIKLLQQVSLRKMEPTDTGLRAITVSWLATYQKVVEVGRLSKEDLRRIDPNPRLAVLIERGVLPGDHTAITSLRATFETAFQCAAQGWGVHQDPDLRTSAESLNRCVRRLGSRG